MPAHRASAAERALTPTQRREIVAARRDGSSITAIANRYRLTEDDVRSILRPAVP
jgi:Mor family transcriptional regulator